MWDHTNWEEGSQQLDLGFNRKISHENQELTKQWNQIQKIEQLDNMVGFEGLQGNRKLDFQDTVVGKPFQVWGWERLDVNITPNNMLLTMQTSFVTFFFNAMLVIYLVPGMSVDPS